MVKSIGYIAIGLLLGALGSSLVMATKTNKRIAWAQQQYDSVLAQHERTSDSLTAALAEAVEETMRADSIAEAAVQRAVQTDITLDELLESQALEDERRALDSAEAFPTVGVYVRELERFRSQCTEGLDACIEANERRQDQIEALGTKVGQQATELAAARTLMEAQRAGLRESFLERFERNAFRIGAVVGVIYVLSLVLR